jgi:hypothetical protein
MSRANQWFIPGDGIALEVITADIQRYLGRDATVRPGVGIEEYQGLPGYWITAYRTLTRQMIRDIRADSQRWQQERLPDELYQGGNYERTMARFVRKWLTTLTEEYQESQTHTYGANYDAHYTTTPAAASYSIVDYPASPAPAYPVPVSAYGSSVLNYSAYSRTATDPYEGSTAAPIAQYASHR